jgi:hypothetical protein
VVLGRELLGAQAIDVHYLPSQPSSIKGN